LIRKIKILYHHVSVYDNFSMNRMILTKFGMNIMSLESTPRSYILGN